jgi:moderate conductance mechanosensitive channel
VSYRVFLAILLAWISFAFPASAQPAASPDTHAADKADALTPDQARRALDTLSDDNKRAEMIDTLRAIANAPAPQSAPAPQQPAPAAAPVPAPQSPISSRRMASARSSC